MYDTLIIGAGIVGTLTARLAVGYGLKTAVLEKENDVADETTMANSAIVHAGYDPEDGTLKAELNVRGARMYPQLCQQLGCRYRQTGAFVCACGKEQEAVLQTLAQRARKRGIRFELLTDEQARELEPQLSAEVSQVLSIPDTAVIYPWQVAEAAMAAALEHGAELYLNHEVTAIERIPEGYRVRAGGEVFESRTVIDAAGLGAARVAALIMPDPGFTITPRRGEYYVLDADVHLVDHVIYPVPTAAGKGVLAVPTVYGNTLIGPNSQPLYEEATTATTAAGLATVQEQIAHTVRDVPLQKTIRTFAGLRPTGSTGDFIIQEAAGLPGFLLAAAIESPGLASAPAIAERLCALLARRLPMPAEPELFCRPKPLVVAELPPQERAALIAAHPEYGRIICRCEQVSEGEIIDCIHRPCGATTIKGVKKRVRPGMGRCQGGFCQPRVLKILARELGIDPTEVLLDQPGSNILLKENR